MSTTAMLPFETTRVDASELKRPRTAIMLNLGNPELAFRTAMLPNDGVGLARMEFIISEHIGFHPMALVSPEKVTSAGARRPLSGWFATTLARPTTSSRSCRKAWDDRRRVLSQARDRPPVGFQDQ